MASKNKRVSIYDVSRESGISIATVSRALNGNARVKPATKEHVLKTAKRLGYTLPERRPGPKPGKPARKKKVAFICFSDQFHLNSDPSVVLMLLQQGIRQTAQENGITVQLHFVSTENQLADELDLTGVCGFLLHGYEPRDDVQAWLKKHPCCWVANNPWTPTWGDHIMPDHREAGMMAAEYLLQRNCRKPVIIRLGLADRVSALREEGFSYFAAKQGVEISSVTAKKSKQDSIQSYPEIVYVDEIITQFKETVGSCDGIFFDRDYSLATLYPIMVAEKLITPGKTVLIGCNNHQPYLKGIDPCPATMDMHFEQIGRVSLTQLLWRIKNPNDKRIRSLISPTLISLS